jgi:ABC-type transporter Mla subunit MlaD
MQDLAGAAEAKLRDADAVIQRLNSGAELQAIMAAHNDALAKLRDAVEVIRKLMQHEPDHADAIWQDARAFLATMEKPHD